jgi:hypothetical protein
MLPAHYLELVQDAALKSFWRKPALRAFLRRCGVSDAQLANWAADETKRLFLDRLFPILERSDRGIAVINHMADFLAQQTSFPDLEGWEDSTTKKEQARAAVRALKAYRDRQTAEARERRDRETTIQRVRAIREEQQARQHSLARLNDQLNGLATRLGSQAAGYEFQDWFYDLCDYFEVENRRPYNTGGRQIDGSLTVDGTTYLVELRFTQEQIGAGDIGDFHKKVISKADNTMGVMVSISGYSSVAIEEASGPRTPLLLMDYRHLYFLLGGPMTLSELVGRLRRHSSQTGEALLPPDLFGG